MRTTIRMNDKLLQEAKERALSEHKSLTAFIEEAVKEKLYPTPSSSGENGMPDFRLVTFRGDGTLPGVDLDNSAALNDIMDG